MDLSNRAKELSEFLARHQPLWNERPFAQDTLSWSESNPALMAWLLSLPPAVVVDLERNPERLALEAPAPLGQVAEDARSLSSLPGLNLTGIRPPARLMWRVPGRKVDQVAAFAQAVERDMPTGAPLVDWCAGKGALGRVLAAGGRQVTNVEQRSELCRAGQRLDQRAGVRSTWVKADVQDALSLLEGAHVVALHACGALHRALVVGGAERRARALMVVPCCYHRTLNAGRRRSTAPWHLTVPPPPSPWSYRPLAGQNQRALVVDEQALRLATTKEVVARGRESRAREKKLHYLLAIDRLVRRATGEDRYHPLPAFPPSWRGGSLGQFLARVADQIGIERPPPSEVSDLERWARKRLLRVRALGLVRGVFRRPIELWLALDLALHLRERGYEVWLGTFCPPSVTPRNLLISARR